MRRGCLVAVLCLCACMRSSAADGHAMEPTERQLAEHPTAPQMDETLPPHDAPAPQTSRSAQAPEPTVPPPTPDAAALTGTWAGTYFYTLASSTGAAVGSVAFFAELEVAAGRMTGSVVEQNTIGDRSSSELRASITGFIGEDGAVRFVKTYDGTGGIDHSVEYVGRLDPVTQQIEGLWKVSGTEGWFVMRRHNRLPELARR